MAALEGRAKGVVSSTAILEGILFNHNAENIGFQVTSPNDWTILGAFGQRPHQSKQPSYHWCHSLSIVPQICAADDVQVAVALALQAVVAEIR